MRLSWFGAAGLSVLLGCSAHPLVKDFARINTYSIVQKVRCEARDAILRLQIDGRLLSPDERLKHIVGFDFKLDMTEKNTEGGGLLEFTNLFGGGKFSLALSGGAEKTRKSERFFRVFGTFDDLARIPPEDCTFDPDSVNLIYPIAGNTGIAEVVTTYWKLGRTSGLVLEPGTKPPSRAPGGSTNPPGKAPPGGKGGGASKKPSGSGYMLDEADAEASAVAQQQRREMEEYAADDKNKKRLSSYPSVFSDTLTFTTKLNAGVKPSVEVAAVAGNFKLTKASIDGTVERLDVHQVSVAISRTDVGGKDESAQFFGTPYGYSLYATANRNPSLITGGDTAPIILELDRLRNRGEEGTFFENLEIVN